MDSPAQPLRRTRIYEIALTGGAVRAIDVGRTIGGCPSWQIQAAGPRVVGPCVWRRGWVGRAAAGFLQRQPAFARMSRLPKDTRGNCSAEVILDNPGCLNSDCSILPPPPLPGAGASGLALVVSVNLAAKRFALLSDHRVAKTIRANGERFDRPVVQVWQPNRPASQAQVVDLSRTPSLRVGKALDCAPAISP
jgi:hypothetical protein